MKDRSPCRHRHCARKHGRETRDDHHCVTVRRALHSGEQTNRTDEAVLNAEYEFAYARAAFDQLLFLFDYFERHDAQ
jgi:hypothetical protein